jgi:hypothetical protein
MKQNSLRATMFKIIVKSHRWLKNCDFYFHWCRHFVELFVIEEHESCIILHLSQLRVFCFNPIEVRDFLGSPEYHEKRNTT